MFQVKKGAMLLSFLSYIILFLSLYTLLDDGGGFSFHTILHNTMYTSAIRTYSAATLLPHIYSLIHPIYYFYEHILVFA